MESENKIKKSTILHIQSIIGHLKKQKEPRPNSQLGIYRHQYPLPSEVSQGDIVSR